MFPLQPSDELVFGTPTTSDHAFVDSNLISFSSSSNDRQVGMPPPQRSISRRIMHRDIERKRRQEMSNLYISLGSVLPIEHNKGKRSACEQVQEAVNHIQQMQKNIQELRFRRDRLKVISSSSGTKIESSYYSDNLPNHVTVHLVQDGLEILIFCSFKNSDFGLSRVLAELVERELDVVSSVSTRTSGGFLHKIRVEARDMTSLDVPVLQNRLTNAIK